MVFAIGASCALSFRPHHYQVERRELKSTAGTIHDGDARGYSDEEHGGKPRINEDGHTSLEQIPRLPGHETYSIYATRAQA
jgi:hypothetical protein